MNFTTPPRPLNVAALIPELAPLARTATRLHPRPGSPTVHDSSVGGPLLWPADEPWPHCAGPHDRRVASGVTHSPDDIRLLRRHRAAAAERRLRNPNEPTITPEELETEQQLSAGRPWFDGPIPMLSVAQFYTRDVPLPTCPPQADLLQVLWCPFDHTMAHPRTTLLWRSSATVTDILDTPPEPPVIQERWYLPEPCLLAPEKITEYPNPMELSKELQDQLGDVSRWERAVSLGDGSTYTGAPQEFYFNNLCHAPGWKTGGWTRWGLTDPIPRRCPECGTEAIPLVTIACAEWDSSTESWIPDEERTNPTPLLLGTPPANFTLIDIAGGYDLQLHACPTYPGHPHIELIQ
ncbi:hypothetical protein [Streptomyces sp. NPDC059071]|uniref:hypothetical protein n=1 Tax=unclassified Streptomyces TaxID=2593676 RepID=UPI003630BB24